MEKFNDTFLHNPLPEDLDTTADSQPGEETAFNTKPLSESQKGSSCRGLSSKTGTHLTPGASSSNNVELLRGIKELEERNKELERKCSKTVVNIETKVLEEQIRRNVAAEMQKFLVNVDHIIEKSVAERLTGLLERSETVDDLLRESSFSFHNARIQNWIDNLT